MNNNNNNHSSDIFTSTSTSTSTSTRSRNDLPRRKVRIKNNKNILCATDAPQAEGSAQTSDCRSCDGFEQLQWNERGRHVTMVCHTANVPSNIVNFRGFDSSTILIQRGGIPRPGFLGISPESLSQAMLVGTMLVGRLGVPSVPPIDPIPGARQRWS